MQLSKTLNAQKERQRINTHLSKPDLSAEAILATNKFDRETVYRVLRLVDVNKYKRRQAPTGVRVTARGFGRDRRYPITNGWHIGE